MTRRVIDLAHPVHAGMPVYPGDPPVDLTVLDSAVTPSQAGKRHLNVSELHAGLHAGTHMDAPFHFLEDGRTIDRVALERCVGPALLVTLPARLHRGHIEAEHLSARRDQIGAVRRVILNTGWYHRWGAAEYFTEHPVITPAAARFLVDCGVELVGVDMPSVDLPPYAAHLTLLGSDVLIVENLTNLDAIPSEVFELVALPLRIAGRDGSPVRAVALV
jgi:kynurenine formamidase